MLAAPEYLGGRLDWHDLDVDADPAHTLTRRPPAAETTSTAHLLPTRVTFPGMPAERFWELEDAVVDLGAVSASAKDLGRVLTVEFATVFGNDWWSVPVPAHFGSLVWVRSLVVRDTSVRRADRADREAAAATAPWRMFRLTDSALAAGPARAGAAAPRARGRGRARRRRDRGGAAAARRDGEPRVGGGARGRGCRRQAARPLRRLRRAADRGADAVARLAGRPRLHPADEVPEHWIPLVPVATPQGPARSCCSAARC